MRFIAENYIEIKSDEKFDNNLWKGIYKFIHDYKKSYNYNDDDIINDNDILNILLTYSKRKNIHTGSMKNDSFNRNLKNIADGKKSSRQTLVFLIYALNIDCFNESTEGCSRLDTANTLLQDYLHQSKLTAHNLTEFILMAGLHTKIEASTIFQIIEKYSELINNSPISSPKLFIGQTEDIEENLIGFNALITNKDSLIDFLESPKNSCCFVKIRNTPYLALFDEYTSSEIWEEYKKNNSIEAVDHAETYINTILNKAFSGEGDSVNDVFDYLSKSERIKYTEIEKNIMSYWLNFYNISDSNASEKDSRKTRFSREQINTLSNIFPSAFIRYETFLALIKRERNADIPAEMYLIALIKRSEANEEGDEINSDYVYGINYANRFVDDINEELKIAGFPTICKNDNFCRLILDTYEDIKKSNPKATSKKIKLLLIKELRSRLSKCINEYNK